MIVRGKRSKILISKIRIGYISNFRMETRVLYLTVLKRKNLSLPLKVETKQFVVRLVLLECLSVKICRISLFVSITVAKQSAKQNIFPALTMAARAEEKFAHAMSVLSGF